MKLIFDKSTYTKKFEKTKLGCNNVCRFKNIHTYYASFPFVESTLKNIAPGAKLLKGKSTKK